MVRYTAQQIIDRAKSLADLQNSNFITWGDCFHMLNASYRKIYQDAINAGDLNYLTSVRLLSRGTSKFSIPEDFYQLAAVTDDYGNDIPRLGLNASKADWGYQIANSTILLQNVRGNVILKYYPIPDTITYKKEKRAPSLLTGVPFSGFDTVVWLTNNKWFDFSTNRETTGPSVSHMMVGKYAGVDVESGNVYYIGTTGAVDVLTNPLLTTSGNLISNTFESIYHSWGWCNDDGSARFVFSDGVIYYNGQSIGSATNLMGPNYNRYNGRCIYWNNKWALVTLARIVYEDGTWETTDSPSAKALLKCDTETGYGYVVPTGASTYTIEGWTPNTVIDYPNNILFDLTAYDLAIQFRIKQSADAEGLLAMYRNLESTYFKSLSSDDANFVTIRNVNKRFSRWSAY